MSDILEHWLAKRTPRSVDNLRLWKENPRLDSENNYNTIQSFVEEITATAPDRKDFFGLVKSIVNKGFIPADPVVVWQDKSNDKYYVAEGNRRVLALKLLRAPHKAPKSIRASIYRVVEQFDRDSVEKIPVAVSPSLNEATWYIFQRHSPSSYHRRWTREQQHRAIADLYIEHGGDLEVVKLYANLPDGELNGIIRILKLKDFISSLTDHFTEKELVRLRSHHFPLSTFERFISNAQVREHLGLKFEDAEVRFSAEKQSVVEALVNLVKGMLKDKDSNDRISSRTTTAEVLNRLPIVNLTEAAWNPQNDDEKIEISASSNKDESRKKTRRGSVPQVLISKSLILNTGNKRLARIFWELQNISVRKYTHCCAAMLRVFLDLTVLEYIEANDLKDDIVEHYSGKSELRQIELKKRIEFLKKNSTLSRDVRSKVLGRLLDVGSVHSLDVLNGYVHSKLPLLTRESVDCFWDQLYPFFVAVLDLKPSD